MTRPSTLAFLQDPSDNARWLSHPDAEPIMFPIGYYCDTSTPKDCSGHTGDITLEVNHNLAMAYVTKDHTPDPVTGHLDDYPGRLMLMYANDDSVLRVAYSNLDDFFDWRREGWASNSARGVHSAGEPGGRATISMLAESGVDANPRAAFRGGKGPLLVWPFVDRPRNRVVVSQVIVH